MPKPIVTPKGKSGGGPQFPAIFGGRMRDRRKSLGLTLQSVADQVGLSAGFISQIERGIAAPSLASLAAVASVLRIEPQDLLARPATARRSGVRVTKKPLHGLSPGSPTYEKITAGFPGNALNAIVIHLKPGARPEPSFHGGEELIYILQGGMTVEIEGERNRLQAGDSIHFASTRSHSCWNHSRDTVTILHVSIKPRVEETEAPAAALASEETASNNPLADDPLSPTKATRRSIAARGVTQVSDTNPSLANGQTP